VLQCSVNLLVTKLFTFCYNTNVKKTKLKRGPRGGGQSSTPWLKFRGLGPRDGFPTACVQICIGLRSVDYYLPFRIVFCH